MSSRDGIQAADPEHQQSNHEIESLERHLPVAERGSESQRNGGHSTSNEDGREAQDLISSPSDLPNQQMERDRAVRVRREIVRNRVEYDMRRGLLSRAMSSRVLQGFEVMSLLNAFIFVGVLFALHFRFVRRDACSLELFDQIAAMDRQKAEGHFNITHAMLQYEEGIDLANLPPILRTATVTHSAYMPVADILDICIESPSPSSPFAKLSAKLGALLPEGMYDMLIGTKARRFRFSSDRGFLLLSGHALHRYNVSIAHTRLPAEHKCFGTIEVRFLLEYVVGYETVIINSLARLMEEDRFPLSSGKRGFLKNTLTGSIYSLSPLEVYEVRKRQNRRGLLVRGTQIVLHRFGAFLTSFFMMCTVGSLVAFALKEVQQRVWKLTLDIQQHLRNHTPYSGVLFRYLLDAVVFVPIVTGILFFLFEFFEDHLLAFAVLFVAWLCELFVMVSKRHNVSIFYLPRLFFIYFLAFHVYYFTYPLGYVWLALCTSVAFMQHAVLVVWNRFEFPLLRARIRENRARRQRTE